HPGALRPEPDRRGRARARCRARPRRRAPVPRPARRLDLRERAALQVRLRALEVGGRLLQDLELFQLGLGCGAIAALDELVVDLEVRAAVAGLEGDRRAEGRERFVGAAQAPEED